MSSSIKKLPNGGTIESFPDGLKIQRTPDGTELKLYPDGRKFQKQKNGITIESFPDGRRVQTQLNGMVLEAYPDGKTVQKNVDGTIIETFSDNRRIQRNPNGTSVEVKPDGSRIQITKDGTKLFIAKDGTVTKRISPTSTKTKAPKPINVNLTRASMISASPSHFARRPIGSITSNFSASFQTRVEILDKENRSLRKQVKKLNRLLEEEKENSINESIEKDKTIQLLREAKEFLENELGETQKQISNFNDNSEEVYSMRIQELEQTIVNQNQNHQSEKVSLNKKIEKLSAELSNSKAELEKSKSGLQRAGEDFEQRLNQETVTLRQQIRDLEASKSSKNEKEELKNIRNDNARLRQDLAKMSSELNREKQNLRDLKEREQESEVQLKQLHEKNRMQLEALTKLEAEKSELESKIEDLIDKGGSIAETITGIADQKSHLEQRIASLESEASNMQLQLADSNALVAKKDAEIAGMMTKISFLSEMSVQAENYRREIDEQLKEINQLREELAQVDEKIFNDRKLSVAHTSGNSEIEQQIGELEALILALREENSMLQQALSESENQHEDLRESLEAQLEKEQSRAAKIEKDLQKQISELEAKLNKGEPVLSIVNKTDPELEKYYRMQKAGLPAQAIWNCMLRDGKNPTVFFKNANGLAQNLSSREKKQLEKLANSGEDKQQSSFLDKMNEGMTLKRASPKKPNESPKPTESKGGVENQLIAEIQQKWKTGLRKVPQAAKVQKQQDVVNAASIAELCKLKALQRAKRANQIDSLVRRNSHV